MPAPKYPTPAPGVTRITSSSMETYFRCGIRYGLEREARHRRATIPMAIGSAVSIGAAVDNQSKKDGGEGVTIPDLVEVTVGGYEAEIAECEVEASRLEIGDGKDSAAAAGLRYGQKVSPMITEVLAAEEPIVAMVSPGLELAGTPDVITPDGIGDTKVGRERTVKEADKSRQLSVYSLLHFSRFGSWPRRVWLDSIHPAPYRRTRSGSAVQGATGLIWDHDRAWSYRGMEDHERTLRLIEYARKGIESGVELPPPEMGAWWCSQKWCPHYGTDCPIMGKKGS